jgi:hypothetical protein
MDAQLLCVAPHLVGQIWPHIIKLIERALLKSNSDYTPDQVRKRIEDGTALLWVIWSQGSRQSKAGELLAAGTTELVSLPDGRKICVVASCAGRNLKRWDCLLADIEQYAKREGCAAVRCYGRPGWVRYLRGSGYTQPWIVVEKTVK